MKLMSKKLIFLTSSFNKNNFCAKEMSFNFFIDFSIHKAYGIIMDMTPNMTPKDRNEVLVYPVCLDLASMKKSE